jgi:membrane-associated phospholipid phosphatase
MSRSPRWGAAAGIVWLSAGAGLAVAQAPYRVTWWDAASIGTAGALTLLPHALHLPHGPPPCAPCDPASLLGIDRAAVHPFCGAASTASSVLLAGVVGFAGVALLEGRPAAAARTNVVVFANAIVWAEATNAWLKVLAHRSRPVLYTSAAVAAAADVDNRRSLPSGHATVAFAAATSYLVIAEREQLSHRARNAVLLYAGAVGVSALRISAGAHFPTDVMAGGLLGSGVGWLAARAHAAGS